MSLSRVRAVVSTNWLREQLRRNIQNEVSKKLRVLDTSFMNDRSVDTYTEFYKQGHIPQSIHFDLYRCDPKNPYIFLDLPDVNCFTDYVQSLGVWSDTHVVAYDRFGPRSAYKTWWLFRAFGHRNISVLDGGLRKWMEDGYEVTTNEPKIEITDTELSSDDSGDEGDSDDETEQNHDNYTNYTFPGPSSEVKEASSSRIKTAQKNELTDEQRQLLSRLFNRQM